MENLDEIIGRKIQYKKATNIRDKYAYIVDRDPLANNFMALFEDERTIWVNPEDFKLKPERFEIEVKEYAAKDQAFLPCFVFKKKEKKIIINRPNYSDEKASVDYATNNAIESLLLTDKEIIEHNKLLNELVNKSNDTLFIEGTKIIESDPVNRPSHYLSSKFEVIDIIEEFKLCYHLGNAQKYLLRAGKKDKSKTKEDIQKCIWYLNRYIEKLDK